MSRISLSSIAILTARVLLIGLAGGAVVAALFIAKRERAHAVDPGGGYLCPMHPEVSSAAPGDCPVCGMALEMRKAGAPPAYLCPMHPEVSSATPGDCPVCGMALEVRKVATGPGGAQPGALTFQLPPAAAVATFDDVGYGKMFEMAREMRAPAWTESSEIGQALFYKDEVAVLGPTEEAIFFPSTQARDGSAPVKVRRIDEPATAWDRSTALIRFRANAKARLTPGKTGSVKFETRTRDTLVVRTPAIVQSPSGPYVFLLAKDNRTLTKRPVEIGAVRMGHVAILSGLTVGERIAAQGTFFLEAERRFAEVTP